MIGPFFSGVILGLVLAMMVGPVFFMVINTSLKQGHLAAVMLAIGVLLSDALYALVTYYGSSLIFYLKKYDFIIGIIGGSLIIVFGILIFTKKPRVEAEALELQRSGTRTVINILKGFTMNTLNPSAFLFWLGVAGTITVKQHFTDFNALLFYSGTLITVFATDLTKSYLATKLKKVITEKFLVWMNRICGSGLIIYGGYMIIRFFT
jgi:threonine/homoserine/homoserine lactone efflux protein